MSVVLRGRSCIYRVGSALGAWSLARPQSSKTEKKRACSLEFGQTSELKDRERERPGSHTGDKKPTGLLQRGQFKDLQPVVRCQMPPPHRCHLLTDVSETLMQLTIPHSFTFSVYLYLKQLKGWVCILLSQYVLRGMHSLIVCLKGASLSTFKKLLKTQLFREHFPS